MATVMDEYKKVSGSEDTVSSSYDILAQPPTHSSSLESVLSEFSPTTAVTDTGPVEIVVPASSSHYIDLANSWLRVRLKVTKGDGSDLSDTATELSVAPGDLMAHSVFKSVELSVNERPLEHAPDYPYKAYLETLFATDEEARKGKHKPMDG